MNLDAKLLSKILAKTEFNDISKRLYSMIKLLSFQGCRAGST
jgi:hypothetical protein